MSVDLSSLKIGFVGHVVGAGGVTVDFDRTVLVQMVLFTLLLLVLEPLLFRPMLKVFALREAKTEGARDEARELQERAGELLRKYESELLRVNQVATEERERLRAETTKLEAQILEEGRQSTAKLIEEGRARVRQEIDRIQFDLGRQTEQISRQVAAQVLGREVN
ncbi:MAG: H(+)-transporting ATPase [Polyangiaceae bacterium]|nr:H(+)-transporting ATPase [Polyangiaceae bacterium]